MTGTVAPDAPRESQTLRLPDPRLDALREWAVEGTGLTAAARVRDPDGRIAFVRNGWSDGWLPPGGAVESGEEPATAARREAREETGLGASVGEPIVVLDQSYVSARTGVEQFTAQYVVYDARADGEIPDPSELGVDGEEIRAARWFESPPQELNDECLRSYL